MTLLEPGDIVFSGYNQRLIAVSTVIEKAHHADPPDPRDVGKWPKAGWMAGISFVDITPPLPYSDFAQKIIPLLQKVNAPFNAATGKGNLGYLYALPIAAGELLAELIGHQAPDALPTSINQAQEALGDRSTEREALSKARIGQGDFRKNLEGYWSGRCAVSECSRRELLRASHIKPWSASNNVERLDPFNGLLLGAAYDAAFDSYLISFNDKGEIIVASDTPTKDLASVGIDTTLKLRRIDPRHIPYLSQHRELFNLRQVKKL